jgi:hypothetical protein
VGRQHAAAALDGTVEGEFRGERVWSTLACGERVSRRCVGYISRIFGGLSIFSGLRKKTAEGKAIFSSHKKAVKIISYFQLP